MSSCNHSINMRTHRWPDGILLVLKYIKTPFAVNEPVHQYETKVSVNYLKDMNIRKVSYFCNRLLLVIAKNLLKTK